MLACRPSIRYSYGSLTDLRQFGPRYATQVIDIIGSDPQKSQNCSATFSLISFDFQADNAILCGPRLLTSVLPGKAAGRSRPIRNPRPGKTCPERATGSSIRVKNRRLRRCASIIPARNCNVVPRRFSSADSRVDSTGSYFQLSKISKGLRLLP